MGATEVIVLAGGLGTRLRQVVPHLPKPLAPVAGRPFLAHLLDMYALRGLRRTILAIGYRAAQIRAEIGTHWQGMEVVYSEESEPLGTGGAVALALEHVGGDGVHIANGDTFLRYDPVALEMATRDLDCPIGVALTRVPDVSRYGEVRIGAHGRVIGFSEKGGGGAGLINAGSYFLTTEGMSLLVARCSFSFETQILQPRAAAGDVAAFVQTSDFIDIGVPEDYARAQKLLGGEV